MTTIGRVQVRSCLITHPYWVITVPGGHVSVGIMVWD